MIKAKLTSKNQLTIPKKVVDYLGLIGGDKVTFTLEQIGTKKYVVMEISESHCIFCKGKGKVDKVECIVCQGTGAYINEGSTLSSMLKMVKHYRTKNYSFSVSDIGGEFKHSNYSILDIKSNVVPKEYMDLFRDFYYTEEIEEQYIKSNREALSSEAIEEFIATAYTDFGKEKLKSFLLDR